ncbi:MAG: hypothetical protein C4291_07490 [Candidatus Dadabacteria bacterium]
MIEEWGFDRFREEFLSLFRTRAINNIEGVEICNGVSQCPRTSNMNHTEVYEEGIYPQKQKGYYRVIVRVPLGELTAQQTLILSRLCSEYGDGRLRTTKGQNLEFHWVRKERLIKLLKGLREIGLSPKGADSILDVVACPGTTFCIWGGIGLSGNGRRFDTAYCGKEIYRRRMG